MKSKISELQFKLTSHELVDDSRKILREIAKLLKDAIDPDFQDTTIIDQLTVFIDDEPDHELSTGSRRNWPTVINYNFRGTTGQTQSHAIGSKIVVRR